MVLEKRFMVCTAVVALTAARHCLPQRLPGRAALWWALMNMPSVMAAGRLQPRSEIEPGVDCPHGSSIHFSNDSQTKIAVARQTWRSQQEIDWISKPPGLDQVRAPVETRFWIWDRAVSYRGYKKRDRNLRQSICRRRSRRAAR